MLTPNDVKERKQRIADMRLLDFTDSLAVCDLYEEVLREIAKGTLDPRSLAIAATEPVKKSS